VRRGYLPALLCLGSITPEKYLVNYNFQKFKREKYWDGG
jgi:hypothetical protein